MSRNINPKKTLEKVFAFGERGKNFSNFARMFILSAAPRLAFFIFLIS